MSRAITTSCPMSSFLFLAWLTASAGVIADEGITLRGRFLLHGDVPEAREIVVNKDVHFCGQRPIKSEDIVVGPQRGLKNVVVYIRDKTIPLPPDDAPQPVVININACRYEPHVAIARTGQEVILRNNDPVASVAHNTNIACVRNSPSSTLTPPGKDLVQIFPSPEDVPAMITCNVHPWMSAWLLIRPNPYACVSDEEGDFQIANVPPGTWEIQFWHEKFGYIKEMTIEGARKSIAKGRMKVECGTEAKDFGEIVLDYGRLLEGKAKPSDRAGSRQRP